MADGGVPIGFAVEHMEKILEGLELKVAFIEKEKSN